jgi:anti-anti-sigma factor
MNERAIGPGFAVSVLRYGATRAVAVEGELDVASVEAFARAVREALRDRPEFLVLDLAALDFIAVAGVHAIQDACRHAVARQARVTVIRPPDPVGRAFARCDAAAPLPVLAPFGGYAH